MKISRSFSIWSAPSTWNDLERYIQTSLSSIWNLYDRIFGEPGYMLSGEIWSLFGFFLLAHEHALSASEVNHNRVFLLYIDHPGCGCDRDDYQQGKSVEDHN